MADLAPFEISDELFDALQQFGVRRGMNVNEAARDLLLRALTETLPYGLLNEFVELKPEHIR